MATAVAPWWAKSKKRYVYYHCTGQKGNCPENYAREETVEAAFAQAIGNIVLPNQFTEWASDVLRADQVDEKRFHDEAVARLTEELKRIERRLEALFVDKYDGTIAQDMFDRLSAEWRKEQARLLKGIKEHQATKPLSHMKEGIQLLELASNTQNLFEKQPAKEKRRLLQFAISNSTWKEGKLTVKYRQPFDLFATWSEDLKKPPASELSEICRNDIWLLR